MFLTDNDKIWQHYALQICQDEHIAKDLVQEMYLKLLHHESLSKRYVYLTMLNDFRNAPKQIFGATLNLLYHIFGTSLVGFVNSIQIF